jgi:uncharacterized membrane protein
MAKTKLDIKNSQKTPYLLWSVATLLFAILLTYFIFVGFDRSIRPAIILVSTFLTISSFVVSLIFRKRYNYLKEDIENGKIISQLKYNKKSGQNF